MVGAAGRGGDGGDVARDLDVPLAVVLQTVKRAWLSRAACDAVRYCMDIGRDTSSGASAPGPRGACQIVGIPRTTPSPSTSHDQPH